MKIFPQKKIFKTLSICNSSLYMASKNSNKKVKVKAGNGLSIPDLKGILVLFSASFQILWRQNALRFFDLGLGFHMEKIFQNLILTIL